MKYKSELIKEIVETRGHELSSLHYQSECVEKWIEETKGAYPKLCDYESEWLNYYLENDGIGKFPYLALDNIRSTTIENTVPIPFKSAILKGQTLINLGGHDRVTATYSTYVDGVYKYLKDVNQYYDGLIINDNTISMFLPSKTYTFIIDSKLLVSEVDGYTNPPRKHGVIIIYEDGTYQTPMTSWVNVGERIEQKIKLTINDKPIKSVEIRLFTTGLTTIGKFNGEVYKVMLVEGDYTNINIDIPYFEGMKSVQMPVLTTTGKNLYNKEINQLPATMGASSELYYSTDYIPVLPNTTYTKSNNTRYELYDINKTLLEGASGSTFTTSSDTRYVLYNVRKTEIDTHQLEQGSTATPYEPYKANILTVNEDVTLRGIGDVKDTIDCLTGQMTERIVEIVLDGSERWESATDKTNTNVFKLYVDNLKNIDHHIISNRFPSNADGDVEKITNAGTDIYVAILKSKADNLKNFKTYLSQNPMTVQYQLKTPVVKTVDLSIIDETGASVSELKAMNGITHIETNGTPLTPTFSGEIPVEAITQNLESFTEE